MPKAKLTMDQARRLRREHAAGSSYYELAERYGIAVATAARIGNNYSYREEWMPRKYQRREAVKKVMNCENPTCGKRFAYWHRRIDPERHYCSRRCNLIVANVPNKKLPDGETLARLYHLRRWSLQRIAIHYGCCFQTVQVAMRRAKIKRRPRTGRLLTWEGRTQLLSHWAKEREISLQTVYSRMSSGQSPAKALRLEL